MLLSFNARHFLDKLCQMFVKKMAIPQNPLWYVSNCSDNAIKNWSLYFFCIVCITNLQSQSCSLHVLFSCLQEILLALCRKGPYTEGVFRKAGNAKALKEIKEQLNNGVEVDLKTKPVILLADLLKVTLIDLNCIYQYLCCVEVYVVISKYVNTLNLIE